MFLWKRLFGVSRHAKSTSEGPSVADLIAQADAFRDGKLWSEAATTYAKALSSNGFLSDIWVQMGNSLKEIGNYEAAQDAYEKAISLNSANADYYLQMGHLCKIRDRIEEAIKNYSRAAQLDPESEAVGEIRSILMPTLQIERGDRARDQEQWAEAEKHYREAVTADDQLDPIWIQLGHSLKEQGKLLEAEGAYRRAAEINEVDPEPFVHIGHILGMQGRQKDAVAAYGRALRLQVRSSEIFKSLNVASGYLAIQSEEEPLGFLSTMDPSAGRDLKSPLSNIRSNSFDVIVLPNVDWRYRKQRPQHLARYLSALGKRVIYVSTIFDSSDEGHSYRIISNPQLGVCEVRLACSRGGFLHGDNDAACPKQLGASLRLLIENLRLCSPIIIVQHPSWQAVLAHHREQFLVYDCLDYVQGFANPKSGVEDSELRLLQSSDLVLCASVPILKRVSGLSTNTRLLRNGVEPEKFAPRKLEPTRRSRPVIGYCGAIAEWFNAEWLEICAEKHPEWDFVLIGRVENSRAQKLDDFANVRFLGEREYSELPRLFARIDVAIIPFVSSELTRHTNPIKLYEYLAAGKPVVATRALEDLTEEQGFIYLADDAQSFRNQIARALEEDTAELRRQRVFWAKLNHWSHRAAELLSYVEEVRPRFDVVLFGDIPSDDHIDEIVRLSMSPDRSYFNSVVLLTPFAKSELLANEGSFYERNDVIVVGLESKDDLADALMRTLTTSYVAFFRLGSMVPPGWALPLLKRSRETHGGLIIVNDGGETSTLPVDSVISSSASIIVASTSDTHKIVETLCRE